MVLDDAVAGTPHHTLHKKCGYTDDCKKLYKEAKDCCDLLVGFLKQIQDGWACLKSKYKGKLPPFGMRPKGGGPDTLPKLIALTRRACSGKMKILVPDCKHDFDVCIADGRIKYDDCVKNGWKLSCELQALREQARCQADFNDCLNVNAGKNIGVVVDPPGTGITIGGIHIIIPEMVDAGGTPVDTTGPGTR